ncbi:MAG: hypothetical protein JO102_06200 [Elusimicrobia bacterium]|nr:hypothetical protein [Elusimicrobiota bacterium]
MKRLLSAIVLAITVQPLAFADSHYLFVDTDCKALANGEYTAMNNIEVHPADKTVTRCTKQDRSLLCAEQSASTKALGETVEYDVLLEGAGLLIAQSKTGNAKIAADLQAERFYYGSVYFSPDRGIMYTKNCTGKIRSLDPKRKIPK